MIRGLRTVIYPVGDIAKGKEWYQQVLGKAPYFDQPYYVGFSVGGFELGLIPNGTPGATGCVAYWAVTSAAEDLKRLNELGGRTKEELQDVGEGIKVASVLDPFGNVFAIIENPHFDPKQVE